MKHVCAATLILALFVLVNPCLVSAVDGPHGNSTCSTCHIPGTNSNSDGFNGICLNCHSSGNAAATMPFSKADQANTSHKWTSSDYVPEAGAEPPTTGALTQVQAYTGSYQTNGPDNNSMACVRCHNPHINANGSYLRVPINKDQLCLDCHRSRNVRTHMDGSHPVLVGYSSAAKATLANFVGKTPVNANPANPGSDLGTFLSKDDGKILCSTCHGVHSADSRSSNYVKGFKNISTGDGNLLRTNPRGAKVASGTADTANICTNCHAGKFNHNAKGQDVQCGDCHGAHVEYDPKDPDGLKGKNAYLIRRNLPGKTNQIFFRYTGSSREYKNEAGTGVCQGCHTVPASIAQHTSTDAKVCNTCHTHNSAKGAFTASCDTCHGFPPNVTFMFSTGLIHPNNTNCSLCHDTRPSLHMNGNLDVSTDCNACHGFPPSYANGSPKANSHSSTGHLVSCNTCHAGTTSTGTTITGATLHMNGQYDLQGGAGASFTYNYVSAGGTCSNISCHGGGGATWGSTADHNALLGTGEVLVFSTENIGDHGDNFTTKKECTLCHYANIATQHSNNCALCHAGTNPPANALIGNWNKTCQQASCHPAIHTSMGINHNGVYWNSSSSCEKCHDGWGGSGPGPANKCSDCHGPHPVAATPVSDTTPPVTTSSFNPAANAIFKANQTVNLTAADNSGGSGVKATYYKIDSGALNQGTSFTVSGDGLHSFSFYSQDNANNTETIHVSSQFRIDSTAPVTTSSAVNGSTYTGDQTFTLSATDGGSGVAGTSYKLDSGAFTSGTSIAVTAPLSGSVSHTISWYSIDNAGNQEATKSVTFSLQAVAAPDTTPPATTSGFNPAAGANFKAGQLVTLSATDSGTGVKTTYYRIDSGAFTAGTSFTVSGDGLHTFSYYSVDNANNTESTHVSNQFRIDTVAPVTTNSAVNGTTYTGNQTFTLSPTDGGSGVAGTWYQLDGGALTSGTSVSVAAPGTGTASHTISWSSIDSAGNQETTKSVTFTVQAVVVSGGTTTMSFRTNASFGGWSYVTWEVHDANGNVVNDINGNPCTWWNDDPGHPSSMWMDFVVPSGVAYTMYGAWGPMPDGPDVDTGTRDVPPLEAASGATITWWWN